MSADYSSGDLYTTDASVTLYAVWSINTYPVTYDANGGSGAPSAQTKTHGRNLTLSSTVPTREGYDFLGWATSSTATTATYLPGSNYGSNSAITLYAVWAQREYEFSISNLSASNAEPNCYGEITVTLRTDSWDRRNAYSGIPIELYYDGNLVSTQYVDFSAYGAANLTFTLYVGDTPGTRSIEARVNWSDRFKETNANNNSVSTSITVKDFNHEMSTDSVIPSDNYRAGETVISAFMVNNDSNYDITPDKNVTATFTAYYYNGAQKIVVATDTWNNVVIPSRKTNLVYFKWTVLSDLSGKTMYCECTVNSNNALQEQNKNDNTAMFQTVIADAPNSQTPNTRFENKAPASYQNTSIPANSTEKATWTMWAYENNQFVLKSYGVQISSTAPVIAPSVDCKTAVYANGKWTIRSGYGFTMEYAPSVSAVSGYGLPDNNAYTTVQYVTATFPEFRYFSTDGNCRTLEYVNGSFQFVENSDADSNARVHFIPVYVKDGDYVVSVAASRVWTPVGTIAATRSANVIIIDGTIYDDWYQG